MAELTAVKLPPEGGSHRADAAKRKLHRQASPARYTTPAACGAAGASARGSGYAIAAGLRSVGMVESALLVAVCLSATALGIIAPVLKDAERGAAIQ